MINCIATIATMKSQVFFKAVDNQTRVGLFGVQHSSSQL
jgi:hypothetical protein